ncbi:hypothetical protein C814_03238 [Anaerotruncus sp. G3(2012)]|uniref:replication initiation factor domain-containing protein n=1 Tax=Anaerotruncus sp. G3(2012) TaxID=1235835 RepID=UPI00033E71B0|nr:replication initiation factor domain-containing protein [Anaerotruncus sp. G3(2012)]EOS55292.1 hypothetical protein C814_03238 [Anaerotruncus sp. G3(2012)]
MKEYAYPGKFTGEESEVFFEAPYFADGMILRGLMKLLGLPGNLEFSQRNGRYGYLQEYYLGGIRFAWGNCDTIMIDLSGEGCRLLETLNPRLDWLGLIRSVEGIRTHNFSRLDIACDTFGELKIGNLIRYTLHGRYISRWKSAPRVVQGREETIDFGSPQSRTMLRIYNKTLERKTRLKEEVEIPEGWIRCEFQFRNDAADSFIREWNQSQDISAVYLGLMANQLRFVKKRESKLDRSETVAWWRRFLDNSEPIRLAYKGGLSYNLDSLQRYLYGQAGSSMKTWLMLSDWDSEKMVSMVKDKKMNDRQQALIRKMQAVRDVPAE